MKFPARCFFDWIVVVYVRARITDEYPKSHNLPKNCIAPPPEENLPTRVRRGQVCITSQMNTLRENETPLGVFSSW